MRSNSEDNYKEENKILRELFLERQKARLKNK